MLGEAILHCASGSVPLFLFCFTDGLGDGDGPLWKTSLPLQVRSPIACVRMLVLLSSRLPVRLFGRLPDRRLGRLSDRSIGRLPDRLLGYLSDRLLGRLSDCLLCHLSDIYIYIYIYIYTGVGVVLPSVGLLN